ncbi:helix-turn-helix domain-containing protein [Spirillospora sp. CA-255316]
MLKTTTITVPPLPAPAGRALPSDIVQVLRPVLSSLAREIVEEIGYSVTEFDRLHQRRTDAEVRQTVEQVLRQFVEHIAEPLGPQTGRLRIHRELGSQERWTSRDLEVLRAASNVGARVVWRRIAEAGRRAEWPAGTMAFLAESVFAFVEDIARYSAEAREQDHERRRDRRQSMRRRLLETVLAGDHATAGGDLADLARESEWRLPATVACVVLLDRWPAGRTMPPAVGPDVLMDLGRPDQFLLVPDPDAPGRHDMLATALQDHRFVIGPSVALAEAALSLRLAVQAISLVRRGVIGCDHFVRCSDELSTLLLCHNEEMIGLMARSRYAPLAALGPLQQTRLADTLLAWLGTGGRAPEMGARLYVHAQTVRYRMRQLRELYGDQMDDPRWKFEMEIILRRKRLLRHEERVPSRDKRSIGARPNSENGARNMAWPAPPGI